MCKLSAVITRQNNAPNLKAAPALLTAMLFKNSETSNRDGFGIGIPATGQIFKRMVSAQTALPAAEPLEWLWNTYKRNQVLIGHVRLSTSGKGSKEDRHAHPFTNDGWMLAHNGHFSNYEELHRTLELPDDVLVDSEIALRSLTKTWGKISTLDLETLQRGLDELRGGYALIMGNQAEPDKLYLIVGSNPLNVYTNDRFHLVNTDSQLLSFLNQTMWQLGIGYGWFQEFTKTELLANHAYVLGRDELVELGKIVPKVDVRQPVVRSSVVTPWTGVQSSSTEHGQNTAQSSAGVVNAAASNLGETHDNNDLNTYNLISPSEAARQVARLNKFLAATSLSQADLAEMLISLPTVVPDTPWELTQYDLEILERWFTYLDKGLNLWCPAIHKVRGESWVKFLAVCDPLENPYQAASKKNPKFRCPYYLNSTVDIESLSAKG